MSQTYRDMEFKVGAFILLTLIIAVFLIFYLGYKKELFAEKVRYFVISKSGESIERGIPVRLSGFKIGQVSDVELESAGNIKIEINILKKHMHWFRLGSRLSVDREGLIGNAFLKLLPAGSDNAVLEPGAVFVLESNARSVSDLVAEAQPAVDDLKSIVANIRALTDQFVDKEGSIQQLLSNLETFSTILGSETGMMNYLLNDERQVLRIESILARTENTMANMEALTRSANALEHDVSGTVLEAQSFVAELRGLSPEIRPILENLQEVSLELKKATKDLDRFRDKGEYTLDLGTGVLRSIKGTWPISRHQELSEPATLPTP
ncbi:MAG: MlaD family protein [Desulfovibrionales bacterium]